MRLLKYILAPLVFSSCFISNAMAEQVSIESTWPSDKRSELSQKQVEIGLNLAGKKLSELFNGSLCTIGVRDEFGYCVIGKYRFADQGRFTAVGYLQSAQSPVVYSPVIIVQSSLTYLNTSLEPDQARAISVDLAETVLDRKLNDIIVEDVDTFFDPRDLDLMHLLYRATEKAGRSVEGEVCGNEQLVSFREGRSTPCTFGSFFVQKTGKDNYALHTSGEKGSVVSGYFGGGMMLIDATVSDANKVAIALNFIETILGIKKEGVTGIPSRASKSEIDPRFTSVTKNVIDFTGGKACDDDTQLEYLRGKVTNCELAGYFFERKMSGEYTVHMRTAPNSTSVAFYILGEKSFMRFWDLSDKPDLDTYNVVSELHEAFTAPR